MILREIVDNTLDEQFVMIDAILMISNNNNSFQNIQQSYDKAYNKMLHHHSQHK